jgi:hypothetical protein
MDVFVDIIKDYDPYFIWKAIFARWLCEKINETIPSNTWEESVQWVRENSESWARIIERANVFLNRTIKTGLSFLTLLTGQAPAGKKWMTLYEHCCVLFWI